MHGWQANKRMHLRYASEKGLCPKNKNHVLCTWMIILRYGLFLRRARPRISARVCGNTKGRKGPCRERAEGFATYTGTGGDFPKEKRQSEVAKAMDIKRGELYYADLSPVVGSEQGGVRPVLVVQNDVGNKYSPTVIAAAVTSKMTKARLPTHIEIAGNSYGLARDSVVLLEQIRTLDKRRLKERIGALSEQTMRKVDGALLVSLGVGRPHTTAG